MKLKERIIISKYIRIELDDDKQFKLYATYGNVIKPNKLYLPFLKCKEKTK